MIQTHHHPMASIADACADEADVLALSLIRMIAAGYATGDVACWDAAYNGAEEVLSPEASATLVATLTTLVRAIRTERSSGWSFLPATCCRVTRHEADILRLLSAGRHGDALAIAETGSDLTSASVPSHLQGAAHIAGRTLNEIAGELAGRPSYPEALAARH